MQHEKPCSPRMCPKYKLFTTIVQNQKYTASSRDTHNAELTRMMNPEQDTLFYRAACVAPYKNISTINIIMDARLALYADTYTHILTQNLAL